jgi:uncharacterized lipoprotein YmbA
MTTTPTILPRQPAGTRFSTRFGTPATLALAAALTLCGCASPPQERFYTLQAQTAPAASPDNGAPPRPRLVLAKLNLPELVDKPQLVIRKNDQQMQILEQQRWAEPLKGALTQALAANLRAQGWLVDQNSDHLALDGAYQLWVDVLQFETSPGQQALLEVQWQVRSSNGALLLASQGVWRETVAAVGIDAVVAAHQRALQTCAQEMGRSLQTLPPAGSASKAETPGNKP